jgi:hypothetical protein
LPTIDRDRIAIPINPRCNKAIRGDSSIKTLYPVASNPAVRMTKERSPRLTIFADNLDRLSRVFRLVERVKISLIGQHFDEFIAIAVAWHIILLVKYD